MEGEKSDELLDEQILGNHVYCFLNWNYTGHLNDPITRRNYRESFKVKSW